MWNPGISPKFWLQLGLALLLLWGCGAHRDPYGQQLKRVDDLSLQGEHWFSQGDYPRANRDFSRALDLSRAIDYPTGVAQQLNNLAAVALEKGELEEARKLFTQAWEINVSQQNWGEASTNQANLATVAQKAGEPGLVEEHLKAAEEAALKSPSRPALGRVYIRWANFSLDQQRLPQARQYLEQAQSLARTPDLKGALQHQWGRLSLAQGDTTAALTHFNQALKFDRDMLDRAAMAADLFYLGETHRLRRDWPQAFSYFERAFDVYAALGKKTPLADCRKRLQEANTQGGLGYSLKRFEEHPR
jgi:tetratricopeptide (TPR) repeat protein